MVKDVLSGVEALRKRYGCRAGGAVPSEDSSHVGVQLDVAGQQDGGAAAALPRALSTRVGTVVASLEGGDSVVAYNSAVDQERHQLTIDVDPSAPLRFRLHSMEVRHRLTLAVIYDEQVTTEMVFNDVVLTSELLDAEDRFQPRIALTLYYSSMTRKDK